MLTASIFTSSSSNDNRPCKHTDRSFFLALQADAKEYPGGIRALADMIGVNGCTLANCLNPDSETQPPSLAVMLEIIKVAQARRAVFALARLVGQGTIDISTQYRARAESVQLFLTLMHTVGEVIGKGSDFAKDNEFDASERQQLEPLLISLMQAAAELIQSMRG